ncbi:MAG: DNA repair protein RecN [Lachnospiraceae bacterium]|nr:DNA repair protein RecN [Lachnospiraceae bacterium]
MLISLHVKNLALIEEAEVDFTGGLNILTGETGAGKSILLGSVNLALGGKASPDMIRRGADAALVELTFDSSERIAQKLAEMDLPEEDGTVTIARKISQGRSVSRINGETVSARQLKELSELLIDIHGQHEHQSLLQKKKHLQILDAYAGKEAEELKAEAAKLYKERKDLLAEKEESALDERERDRELELLSFEQQEIEAAALKDGEDEELEKQYSLMVNGQKIGEALGQTFRLTGGEEEGASTLIGRAAREIGSVAHFDEKLASMQETLLQTEELLNDFNRECADYMESMEFDGALFAQVEERLNVVNRLKEKYGGSIGKVKAYGEEIAQKTEKLKDYEVYRAALDDKIKKKEAELTKVCGKLTKLRNKNAETLAGILQKSLVDLNFLTVEFVIDRKAKEPSADGADDVEFLLSTNPGETPKSLGAVASGGELSRIMLAIKAVLAEKDAVDTLIFDEIDTGISGRTAWRVSEKLSRLSEAHQVICITHLPQIAAMADSHFVIEKETDGSSTQTEIRKLSEEGTKEELARLLGADSLSEKALENAGELRKQAENIKQKKLQVSRLES